MWVEGGDGGWFVVVGVSCAVEESAVLVGGDTFVVFDMSTTRAFLVATSAPAEKKLWRVRFFDMFVAVCCGLETGEVAVQTEARFMTSRSWIAVGKVAPPKGDVLWIIRNP